MINSYKNLIVWQRAIELVLEIYKVTEQFPKEELYGLTSQIRRAAVSIPANISEGRYRGTKRDFVHFLRTANGSGAELETHIVIAKNLLKTKHLDYSKIDCLLVEVMKMLNAMIRKLNPNEANEAIS